MKFKLIIFLLFIVGCNSNKQTKIPIESSVDHQNINCSDKECQGTYTGKEFINGSDVAHQHSNKMAAAVGDKLKDLYDKKKYSKVDLPNIKMTTTGMGTGMVEYKLMIPFIPVDSKCKSFTSFDHVGGWNHKPELSNRKKQLKDALLFGDSLQVSELKTTKEGLQEYWIQWRNKDKQSDCLN